MPSAYLMTSDFDLDFFLLEATGVIVVSVDEVDDAVDDVDDMSIPIWSFEVLN